MWVPVSPIPQIGQGMDACISGFMSTSPSSISVFITIGKPSFLFMGVVPSKYIAMCYWYTVLSIILFMSVCIESIYLPVILELLK